MSACTVDSGGEEPVVDAAAGGADLADAAPPDAPGQIGDIESYCNDFAVALCDKFFTCWTVEVRDAAGVPATEEECVEFNQTGCATSTSADMCEPGEAYQPDQATPCLTQFVALTCEQFNDPDVEAVLAAHAPACAALCQ